MTYSREAPKTLVVYYDDGCVIRIPYVSEASSNDFLKTQPDVTAYEVVPYKNEELV